jgi:prepilin-type processing-associated H-X9-DG protein
MKRNGFIDLAVVISIVAIVAVVVMPAVTQADKESGQNKCISNLKSLGVALTQYAQDNEGRLPPMWTKTQAGSAGTFWCSSILPYLQNEIPKDKPIPDAEFGPQWWFGANFMRCPGAPEPTLQEDKTHYDNYFTYGLNYPALFTLAGSPIPKSALLERIPASTFMAADCNGNSSYHGLIYNPGPNNVGFYPPGIKFFPLDTDTDGDDIKDTSSAQAEKGVHYYPYNGVAFRHNDGANFLMADCHLVWLAKMDWVTNKDLVWGTSADSMYER